MTFKSNAAQPALQQHVDTFVRSFFVNGARNYIRKTTPDAPWLNVGIVERTNPDLLYASKLFAGMNVIGGGAYSLGHGFIHGYLNGSATAQVERAIANLNALGADEIIFYHDESLRGLEAAREMGLDIRFKPVALLEWLVGQVRKQQPSVRPLDAGVAVQLPCSWQGAESNNLLLEELFGLIGVRRVQRQYDRSARVCCGARGYFGLLTGDAQADADRADTQARQNVADAKRAGATYLVTLCPYCYAALAPVARQAGLTPLQVEGLASLALYDEPVPGGLVFV